MKKIITILFCLFLLSLPAFAENVSNTITSTASASKEVSPDIVSFSATVITEGKSPEEALKENNSKSKKVYDALKTLLNEEDKIKTSSFRISPFYKWDKALRENRLKGYRVSNEVQVKTKQLNELGKMLQTAIDSGANSIDNLVFAVENDEAYCNELVSQAAKKAREKAQILAKALDIKIIGIKHVNSSCNKLFARPVQLEAGAMKEKSMQPPLEPGEVELNARVTIEFLIEN